MKKIVALVLLLTASQAFAGAKSDLEKSAGLGGFKALTLSEAQYDVSAPKLSKAAAIPADALLSDEEKKALAQVQDILKTGGAVSSQSRVFLDQWFKKFLEAGLVGRSPSVYEKKQLSTWFPNLYDNKWWRVTGEACGTYNCIAWSVGVTNTWLWPGTTEAIFDKFYLSYGYVPLGVGEAAERAEIAYWEKPGGESTHGCRKVAGEVWESKLGSSLRILHTLTDLESATYGRVAKFYRRASDKELAEKGMDPAQIKDPVLLERMANLRRGWTEKPSQTLGGGASCTTGSCGCGGLRKEMSRSGPYDMGSPDSRL